LLPNKASGADFPRLRKKGELLAGMGKAFYICTRFAREALLWRAVEKKLQNKFGGLEIKFYLCTRFESRAANFRERGFLEQGAHGTKRK
jgi:hypothetical protein